MHHHAQLSLRFHLLCLASLDDSSAAGLQTRFSVARLNLVHIFPLKYSEVNRGYSVILLTHTSVCDSEKTRDVFSHSHIAYLTT
jgi:hypothetical protein